MEAYTFLTIFIATNVLASILLARYLGYKHIFDVRLSRTETRILTGCPAIVAFSLGFAAMEFFDSGSLMFGMVFIMQVIALIAGAHKVKHDNKSMSILFIYVIIPVIISFAYTFKFFLD